MVCNAMRVCSYNHAYWRLQDSCCITWRKAENFLGILRRTFWIFHVSTKVSTSILAFQIHNIQSASQNMINSVGHNCKREKWESTKELVRSMTESYQLNNYKIMRI